MEGINYFRNIGKEKKKRMFHVCGVRKLNLLGEFLTRKGNGILDSAKTESILRGGVVIIVKSNSIY